MENRRWKGNLCPVRNIDIPDKRQFEVIWIVAGWKTTQTALSRSQGNASLSADIKPGATVEWTLRWPEQAAWLGYNVVVKVAAN